jgi:hypothetical protein
MLDLRLLSYFRSVTTGGLVVALEIQEGFADEDASGLVLPVPINHSLRDAAGGSIVHLYRFFQGIVVKPGDFIIISYDGSRKGEKIEPVYTQEQMAIFFKNVDIELKEVSVT